MTTAQVVETSVTVNNNSPIQDDVHPDDQTQPTFEMTPGFKPFKVLVHLDDRANDLLTTTSVTQVTSDEYDNNSGSTIAAKILAMFREDLDLSPR